jgi:hypothetical protein
MTQGTPLTRLPVWTVRCRSISASAWAFLPPAMRPQKLVLTVTYAQDLSDNFARKSRTLMTTPFYEALFPTRISKGREAVSDFETTGGGYRLSTSIGGDRSRCRHHPHRRPNQGR